MEFRLRKGFTGSGSLLPKNKPNYGSVGIRLPKIIAATLRHLHLSERLQKISGLKCLTLILKLHYSNLFMVDVLLLFRIQVYRVRAKWKFALKDGVMNLKGHDYIFCRVNGEADW